MNDPQYDDNSPLYPLVNWEITDGFGTSHCARLFAEMQRERNSILSSTAIQALSPDARDSFTYIYDRFMKAFDLGRDDGIVSMCG